MIRFYSGIAILGLVFAIGGTVSANEARYYFGASIGQSKFSINESDVKNLNTGQYRSSSYSTSELDDSSLAWAISFDYRFTPHFALEASVIDFGESVFRQSAEHTVGTGMSYRYSGELSVGVRALSLAAAGIIPVGNFELNGKLGMLYENTKLSWSGTRESIIYWSPPPYQTAPHSTSETSNTVEVLIGVGASYRLTERIRLRADFALVPNAGDEEVTGEGRIVSLTVGAQFRL